MATSEKGILSHYNGTVGTVVGSSWRGINYLRSRPGKRKGLPTQKQLDQQARFTLMTGFLQSMKDLLDVGFNNYASGQTALNSALSYNLQYAVSGTVDTAAIQYNQVLISKGNLPTASDPKAIAGAAGQIEFSWTNMVGVNKAADEDVVILAVYSPTHKLTAYTLAGGTRADAKAALSVPAFSGTKVETWLSFLSVDGKTIASSLYTGQVQVV